MSTPSLDLRALIEPATGSVALDGATTRVAQWSRSTQASAGIALEHDSGLRLEQRHDWLADSVVRWGSTLTNAAGGDSPQISQIRSLDMVLPAAGPVTVHATNGSRCQMDDFLPRQRELVPGDRLEIQPTLGRSSDGALPFLTLDLGGAALAIGVGWTGQWVVEIVAGEGEVTLRVGLAEADLTLYPGEAITLPSVIAAGGATPSEARNALRAALSEHVLPRREDGGPVTPLAHMRMATFHKTRQTSQELELQTMRATAETGLEAFWMDACWYGDRPDWHEEVGTWSVRAADFPNGLAPIADAAHDEGLGFVLWFEPERARSGSAWVRDHPGLFLPFPDDADNHLLDLGLPEARELALNLVSGMITDVGIDVYRQDFNIAPLPAWRAADEAHRRGIHEIRHIEGLYWFWDALLAAHPGLVIDNCASGGRRIDLETLGRSVPLWRSDAADVGGGAEGDGVALANQVQVAGLGAYVEQHTGPIWAFDAYHVRSGLSTGFVVYCPLPEAPSEQADLRAAIVEVSRLRPLLRHEAHHLIAPTLEADAWAGVQYHDPTSHRGFAVLLRRPGSTDEQARLALSGIDTARDYLVTISRGYEAERPEQWSGAVLASFTMTLSQRPGSALVEYAAIA